MKRFVSAVCAVVILSTVGASESARASLIVNGDFEAWDEPAGAPNNWGAHNGPNFEQAPGLDGSNNSLQINPQSGSPRGVYQDFVEPLEVFSLSFDFAVEDPGDDETSLRVTLRSGVGLAGTSRANIRVAKNEDGTGDLLMFSGSWHTVGAGLIEYSDFAGNDLQVYRLTLSGVVNTGNAATLRQSIRLFDVTNNSLLLDEDLGTGIWQSAPTSVTLSRIYFESVTALHASFRIDNVVAVVPEPCSVVLAGLAWFGFGAARRRVRNF